MRQLGLDGRPVRSSSLASRPARVGGLHGDVACTADSFIREREERPANEGLARGVCWLHIFKVEGQDGAAYQAGDNSEVNGAEGPLTCETLSGLWIECSNIFPLQSELIKIRP